MTVKLKDERNKEKFKNLCKKLKILIESENILGYYDLILSGDTEFYEIYDQLEESGLFYSIEVITYAKLHDSNDPGFSNQYFLENNNGEPDININAAWTITKGSPNVIVAVIDHGVDIDNSDINLNIWNDYGWDYVENDSYPDPSYINNEHHGISVAGIISAETNNGTAVAGVAGGWSGNGGSKIMSLRVFYNLNGKEESKTEKIDDAIIFAANHGAKIINMSFGVVGNEWANYQSSIDAAIEYAYKQKGCLLVASSGNETKTGIYYPARNPYVMAIGGILKNWQNYGRYGSELEIVAPAEGIYTLLTSSNNSANWGLFGNTNTGNGTSASSPQVAGVAALILSKYPYWLNYDIRKILNRSAFDLGNKLKFGNGLLQANVALQQANPNYQNNENRPHNVTLTGNYGSHPTINWPKVSTDYIDHYNIYRAYKIGSDYHHYQKVAEVIDYGQNSFSWTDNSVVITHPRQSTSIHYYRVTAVNYEDIESVTSNEVSTHSNWTNKINSNNKNDENIFNYSLNTNYPNPFNPSTIISYSIKDDGIVLLTIKDILGRTVKTLVNEWHPKGYYKVKFDTENKLASGVYFYTLRVNNYINTKKLIISK